MAAAGELGIHRHTMRNRIRRIGELLDGDLDSADTRAQLWLASIGARLNLSASLTPAGFRWLTSTAICCSFMRATSLRPRPVSPLSLPLTAG